MKALLIGAGGVGSAITNIATRRDFITSMVVADRDFARAEEAVARVKDPRFTAAEINAAQVIEIQELIRKTNPDIVINAVDPRFVMPIFLACENENVPYLDMAMSLSTAHPEFPLTKTGIKLGDEQFAREEIWKNNGNFAIVGMGIEPGLSDVFARYAADELFSEIDSIAVMDGSNLTVEGYEFAPSFSIWTTIEECLNPPLIWKDGAWHTAEAFSGLEVFNFPEGIGDVECVDVEHEEVVLIPMKIKANSVNFKFGLGAQFIETLKTIHLLGLDSKEPISVQGQKIAPRDFLAALLPDPAKLGSKMRGKTCAGTLVKGVGKDGQPRAVYLYNVVDNAWSMENYGDQAVVWQTAFNPVIAMELIHNKIWQPAGINGPEWFAPKPFLDLLAEYGTSWHLREEKI